MQSNLQMQVRSNDTGVPQAKMYVTNKALYDEIEAELNYIEETVKFDESYKKFLTLKKLKEMGNYSEYNILLEQILSELKQKYREECM